MRKIRWEALWLILRFYITKKKRRLVFGTLTEKFKKEKTAAWMRTIDMFAAEYWQLTLKNGMKNPPKMKKKEAYFILYVSRGFSFRR